MWWALACGPEGFIVAVPDTETAPSFPTTPTTPTEVGRLDRVNGAYVALVADLGGDGADDLVTHVEPGDRVSIWPEPMGSSGSVVLQAPEVASLRAAAAGDLTGDGAPDLWLWDAAGPAVRHLVPGPFDTDDADVLARAVDALPLVGAPLAPVDANADGYDDYVSYPYVCYGPFPDGVDLGACLQRTDAADGAFTSAGDLDGDSRPELVATLFLAETARTRASALLVVHGANPLGPPFLEVLDGGAGALADLDADGALDLAWWPASSGDQPLDVAFGPWAPGAFLTAGAAELTDPVTFVGVFGAGAPRAAVTAGSVTWAADLSLPESTTLATSAVALDVFAVLGRAIGDLDGDGADDLLLATSLGEYWRVSSP